LISILPVYLLSVRATDIDDDDVMAVYRVGGAMVGSLACFSVADWLGRRGELLVASALFTLGATIEYLSGCPSWGAGLGITILLLGRIIYGAACGFAMHGVC